MSVEARPGLNDLESIIGFGENPKGFVSQTANGTAKPFSTGWNYDPPYSAPEIEPHPTWPAGRSTRAGE